MKKIATIKIHPAIGVARIGNSPTGFFIGPEKPGVHRRPPGGYRDAQGRIKRQAARFRVFGYDKNGKVVREITAREATITWTVHLANKKAEWIRFQGPQSATNASHRRNSAVANRASLIIDPGARTLVGPDQHASFDTGAFLGANVPLGDARTDRQGRLLVLGGFGRSGSPGHVPIDEGQFANNDGWHDDLSDGPVNATIEMKSNGARFEAAGSWVLCAAPKFAPHFDHVVTLYDVLSQVAVDTLGMKVPAKPSFARDILPLLRRAILMKWVSGMVAHPPAPAGDPMHHEGAGPAHGTFAAVLAGSASAAERAAIFERLRDPALPPDGDSGESDMPMIHSDVYPAETNQPLTRLQYAAMRKWKEGRFIHDAPGPSGPPEPISPEGLDRAALESCVGGPFYPGIEAGWMLRDTYPYVEPFRLDQASLEAGDVTKQMAVPWQADFADCRQEGELAWWPAQRPDDVFPEDGGPQVPWTRDLLRANHGMSDMVKNWNRLGFILKRGDKYVERERDP